MKQKLLVISAVAALLLPVALRAQEENKPVDRQTMHDQLQALSPEERAAKIRELREKGSLPGGVAGQRQVQGGASARLGGDMEHIALVLTPAQRESIRKSSEENRDKVRDLEEKVRAARKITLDAALDKKFDEAVLRQKLEAAAKLDIELLVIRARALSKVEPPLTDEQIQRIKNPMADLMRQRPGQGPNGLPAANRDQVRPRPQSDGPRDANDLPMPAKP